MRRPAAARCAGLLFAALCAAAPDVAAAPGPSGTLASCTAARSGEEVFDCWGLQWTKEGAAFAQQPTDQVPTVSALPASSRPSLGGDYWNVPVRLGNGADRARRFFVNTRVRAGDKGRIVSSTFELDRDYVSLLVGGGGGPATRVELHVKLDGTDDYRPFFVDHGPGVVGMRRVAWHVGLLARKGAMARVLIIDDSSSKDPSTSPAAGLPYILVDDVEKTDVEPQRSPAPVFGFADLHVHLLNHLGFGGSILHGCVWSPGSSSESGPTCALRARPCADATVCDASLATAMAECSESHGQIGRTSSVAGDDLLHAQSGYPTFDGWPTFHDVMHQKVYIDWLKRAHEGGLRLIQLDAGNSFVLASANLSNTDRHLQQLPVDDDAAIDLQLDAAWQLVHGPARDWAAIARTPAEARRIIEEGKLAIVLGIETDTFGGFSSEERIAAALRKDPNAFRAALQRLYDRGVRHVVPIHLSDNAFGGTAVFQRMWHSVTERVTGRGLQLKNGFVSPGVRYRLDQDPPEVAGLVAVPPVPRGSGGLPGRMAHANREGLSPWGRILIKEMMRLGMLIDVDHMSDAAVDETLALVKEARFPVMASHGGPRALFFGARATHSFDKGCRSVLHDEYHTEVTARLASERNRTDAQLRDIARLGGVIGVGMASAGYFPGYVEHKLAPDCEASSVSFAEMVHHTLGVTGGRQVAFGTDVNGFAPLAGPRFGAWACASDNRSDGLRKGLVRCQADAQRRGVQYDWTRIGSGKKRLGHWDLGDVYTSSELDAWQWLSKAFLCCPTRSPFTGSCEQGFARTHCGELMPPPWRSERAPFDEVLGMWNRAHEGNGGAPLVPSVAGERVFDLNFDGVAHYGMMPDFMQDLRNIGVPTGDLQALMYSAEDYIRMWELAVERRSRPGDGPSPPANRAASRSGD